MQTFLPYPDFKKTAECLDYRRLGKQRVEARQILAILRDETASRAWRNHPAVRMWNSFDNAVAAYYNVIVAEWVRRGYRNTMPAAEVGLVVMPPWFGLTMFHASHRSNLLRKDSVYYGKFNWAEPNDLPYWWPVKSECNEL